MAIAMGDMLPLLRGLHQVACFPCIVLSPAE
jgi:hypothetical protein